MKIYVSTAINEDLEFLAEILVNEDSSSADDVILTRRGSAISSQVRKIECLYSLPASSPLQFVNAFALIFRLVRLAGSANEIILLSPSVVNFVVVLLAGFSNGIRLRAVVHDPIPHYSGVRGLLYDVQNKCVLSRSVELICYSEYSRALLARQTKSGQKIKVLPLASPVDRISRGLTLPAFSERKYDFVWWGRPEEYKGVGLLENFAHVLEDRGKSLLVVSNFPKSSRLAKRLMNIRNVTLIQGRLDTLHLADMLLKAKINLCPYMSATQSGVLSFCASLGLPSAVFPVGALPEQVAKIGFGVVVDSITDKALITYLDRDYDTCPRMLQKRYFENLIV